MRSCLENRVWKWRSLSGAHHQQHLSSAAFPLFLTLVFLFIATVFTSSDLLALGVSFRGCCVQSPLPLRPSSTTGEYSFPLPQAILHLHHHSPQGARSEAVGGACLCLCCGASVMPARSSVHCDYTFIYRTRPTRPRPRHHQSPSPQHQHQRSSYLQLPRPASAHLLRRLTRLLGIALLAQPPLSALLRPHFAHYFRACGSPHSAGLRIRFGKHHSLRRS